MYCVCRPVFLPNPSDGSLYTFDVDEGVKKLPFSIPSLVSTAPCKSSDGRFLYTGWLKKFTVDSTLANLQIATQFLVFN